MNVPTPMNDTARDDRFNRGLERLLDGDPTGIDEIEPELQDVAIQMVRLANDAGWIGSEPGHEVIRPRPWWQNGRTISNVLAAVAVIGLLGILLTYGLREWNPIESRLGSDSPAATEFCLREPRTNAEIAKIVRKSEARVEPFRSDGIISNGQDDVAQLTLEWNACLAAKDWHRAMAYESEYFIWLLGQKLFPNGTAGLSDGEISDAVAERHVQIVPVEFVDGLHFDPMTAENFRTVAKGEGFQLRGLDVWLSPLDGDGQWLGGFIGVTAEWDGTRWVIVSASRDGIPESEYKLDVRDLPGLQNQATPDATP